jgi:Fic family protein
MLCAPPILEQIDEFVLGMITQQRELLRRHLARPMPWHGAWRRGLLARSIVGSVGVAGYKIDLEDAIAAIGNEPPPDGFTESWLTARGYRDASIYVGQAASDPDFEFGRPLLKSLHFMMVGHRLDEHPGQWRPGAAFVGGGQNGEVVYEAPDAASVNGLVGELIAYLDGPPAEPAIIRGAMAHLNLVMIHPFTDGNGRMGRALQTLVTARDGRLPPALCSVEAWLADNVQDYCDALATVGGGRWNPRGDSLPWVRLCLKGHYQEAATALRRCEEYGETYDRVHAVTVQEKLPERMSPVVFDVCLGSRMTNSRYRAETGVSEFLASRDLRRLADLGLFEAEGANRGRSYAAGDELRQIRQAARTRKKDADPYEIVAEALARVNRPRGNDAEAPRPPLP